MMSKNAFRNPNCFIVLNYRDVSVYGYVHIRAGVLRGKGIRNPWNWSYRESVSHLMLVLRTTWVL